MEKKVYIYPNEVNEVFYESILPLLKKYKVKEKILMLLPCLLKNLIILDGQVDMMIVKWILMNLRKQYKKYLDV